MRQIDSDHLRESKQFRFFRQTSYFVCGLVIAHIWGILWALPSPGWIIAAFSLTAYLVLFGISLYQIIANCRSQRDWDENLDGAQFVYLCWIGLAGLAGLAIAASYLPFFGG